MLFPDPDAALQNALERNHDTNADTLSKVLSYFDDAPTPGANERERQARYWDTYNAALPEAMRVCRDENAGTNRLLDDVHELCTMHADRAHWPLEGRGPSRAEFLAAVGGVEIEANELLVAANALRAHVQGNAYSAKAQHLAGDLEAAINRLQVKPKPISGAEFVDGMEEAINNRNADVDALVKAALAGAAVLREYGGDYTAGDLEAACEPFERQGCPHVGCKREMPHTHVVNGPYENVSPSNTAHPSDFKRGALLGHLDTISPGDLKRNTPPAFAPCPVAGCTLYVKHSGKCTGGEP